MTLYKLDHFIFWLTPSLPSNSVISSDSHQTTQTPTNDYALAGPKKPELLESTSPNEGKSAPNDKLSVAGTFLKIQ